MLPILYPFQGHVRLPGKLFHAEIDMVNTNLDEHFGHCQVKLSPDASPLVWALDSGT